MLMLDGVKELPRTSKAMLALAIMAAAVIPASLGLVPIAISALGGAIAMLVTGCVRFDRIGRALSGKVIVLVAASIAIGRIVLESGAATWLSELIALGLQFLPPAGVLAAVMLFVTLLTNFASNTTAAAVGTPIAFSLGKQLGIPVEPLVFAVLFGCNLCYATPIAYQTKYADHVSGRLQVCRLHAHRPAARRAHGHHVVRPAGHPLWPVLRAPRTKRGSGRSRPVARDLAGECHFVAASGQFGRMAGRR